LEEIDDHENVFRLPERFEVAVVTAVGESTHKQKMTIFGGDGR
jgi:hypothetical protein